jgi:eukaryotic-like serine/threonine-protein kinase
VCVTSGKGAKYDGGPANSLRCTSQSSGDLVPASKLRQVYVDPLREPGDPTVLGGIALRGRLGEGGMGTVYYGVSPDGDEVAVKTIRDFYVERPALRNRFEREVEAMEMVQGPRVANLIAAAAPGEPTPWLAVEYVRGLTLAQHVTEHGTMSVVLVAALGIALADALASIHQAGVLHRDMKPGNIILGPDGPRVIDFGLAALIDRPGHLTFTHDVLGTPACMSPEQAISSRDVTAATDVYALGATLTFAVAGHYPYQGESVRSTQSAIVDPAIEPDLSGIPAVLLPAISSMLAYAATARPAVTEVHAALSKILADASLTDPDAAIQQLAEATFREHPGSPERPRTIPPPQRLPDPEGDPRVPSTLVKNAAERLRRDYAASAPF